MIFENLKQSTPQTSVHHNGLRYEHALVLMLICILGTFAFCKMDTAVAFFTHEPSAATIVAHIPEDELDIRKEYAKAVESGLTAAADAYRKSTNVQFANVDTAPISSATADIETDNPPAPAESPAVIDEGNA